MEPGQFEVDFSTSCIQSEDVCSNRISTSSSGEQPKATAIACIVLGVRILGLALPTYAGFKFIYILYIIYISISLLPSSFPLGFFVHP